MITWQVTTLKNKSLMTSAIQIPFQRRLNALRYPHAGVFALQPANAVDLAQFLESQIFHSGSFAPVLEVAENHPALLSAFNTWIGSLGGPSNLPDLTESSLRILVDWMTSSAVGKVYAARYNGEGAGKETSTGSDVTMAGVTEGENAPSASLPFPLATPPVSGNGNIVLDCSSEEFRAELESLAGVLGVPVSDDVSITLAVVSNLVARKLNDAALEAAAGGEGEKAPGEEAFDNIPLGFSTGDVALDRAAKVLRLLYIADLRDLQSKINDLIQAVQNYTANPKTDARLGRVGK